MNNTMHVNITWNKQSLEEFKKVYENTKKELKDDFFFKGHLFLVSYAKYLIEYLETQFK